jgi:hypothetical protein
MLGGHWPAPHMTSRDPFVSLNPRGYSSGSVALWADAQRHRQKAPQHLANGSQVEEADSVLSDPLWHGALAGVRHRSR